MPGKSKSKTRASTAEAAHAMSLLGANLAPKTKPCEGMQVTITCKPQLVSCKPVTTTPCNPVIIVIN